MFTVYALKSLCHSFIYVGMTENLEERLRRQNLGYNKSTKRFGPFKLIYSEICETGQEARIREKYLNLLLGKDFCIQYSRMKYRMELVDNPPEAVKLDSKSSLPTTMVGLPTY